MDKNITKRGFFNTYRKGIPQGEQILKDLLFVINWFILFVRNGFQVKVIRSHPSYPSKKSVLYKIAKELGYSISNKTGKKPQCEIIWEYTTFRNFEFKRKSISSKLVNNNVNDISKTFVDRIHAEVFGYNTEVDPLSHSGICVQKSILNAVHDGKKIQCPVGKKEENVIYQLLIDNQSAADEVVDIRVPVFNNEIPLVYLKFKKTHERFTNNTSKSILKDVNECLSIKEQEDIIRFCKKIQLDYGELDVLRDKNSGKIYIVDVNNTPHGPPDHLSSKEYKKAIKILSESFKNNFLVK